MGPALVLGIEDFRIPQRFVSIDAVEAELARLHSCLDIVWNELLRMKSLRPSNSESNTQRSLTHT